VNNPTVLDASALLCLLRDEPGADKVANVLASSVMSAVNLSEVIAKLADVGMEPGTIDAVIGPLRLQVVPFDAAAAMAAGLLRPVTRGLGLSFGDRACLALASAASAQAVTTDRMWSKLEIGVEVVTVR
jgi:PIN domain nuclease of toxin-antitoxin system